MNLGSEAGSGVRVQGPERVCVRVCVLEQAVGGSLPVLPGLVFEVVEGLPEESHAEEAAVMVLKQQAVSHTHTQTDT